MIEYIYNMIRASSGEDVEICAIIEDDSGEPVTDGCGLRLYSNDMKTTIYRAEGIYGNGVWTFVLPGEITKNLRGRHWYCFCQGDRTLCFKQPLCLLG
jgi:hypothetical protein